MVILSVVFIVKTIHHHDCYKTYLLSENSDQVSSNEDCPICDFHFTKDIEILTTAFSPIENFTVTHFLSFYQSIKTSSIGLNYSDRGPPAFFS